MTHLLVGITALAALCIVLAVVFALQRERPRLRVIGVSMLCALAAALVVGLFTA